MAGATRDLISAPRSLQYKGAFVATRATGMQVSQVRQHKHGNGCKRIYFLVRLTARSLPSVFFTVSAMVVLRCRVAGLLSLLGSSWRSPSS